MEQIRLQLIPIKEMNKDLYCQDGMHALSRMEHWFSAFRPLGRDS